MSAKHEIERLLDDALARLSVVEQGLMHETVERDETFRGGLRLTVVDIVHEVAEARKLAKESTS